MSTIKQLEAQGEKLTLEALNSDGLTHNPLDIEHGTLW